MQYFATNYISKDLVLDARETLKGVPLPPSRETHGRHALVNDRMFCGVVDGIAYAARQDGYNEDRILTTVLSVIQAIPRSVNVYPRNEDSFKHGTECYEMWKNGGKKPAKAAAPQPIPPIPPVPQTVPAGIDKIAVPTPTPDMLPADAPEEIKEMFIDDEFVFLFQHYWINKYLHEQDYVWYGGDKGLGKTLRCEALSWYIFQEPVTTLVAPKDWAMEIAGYISPLTNQRITTPAAEKMLKGGLILIDEPSSGYKETMKAFNQVLQSRVITLPGIGEVKIHEDCMFIAADNTFGEGATEMYMGETQDASLLSRFPKKLTAQWSDTVANAICPYTYWVKFMKDWNQATMNADMPRHQKFYRELSYIAKDMARNEKFNVSIYTPAKILQTNFLEGVSEDDLTTIYDGLQDKSCSLAASFKGMI